MRKHLIKAFFYCSEEVADSTLSFLNSPLLKAVHFLCNDLSSLLGSFSVYFKSRLMTVEERLKVTHFLQVIPLEGLWKETLTVQMTCHLCENRTKQTIVEVAVLTSTICRSSL